MKDAMAVLGPLWTIGTMFVIFKYVTYKGYRQPGEIVIFLMLVVLLMPWYLLMIIIGKDPFG